MEENLNNEASNVDAPKNEGQPKAKKENFYTAEEVKALIALEVEKNNKELMHKVKSFNDGEANVDSSKKLDKEILFITKRLGLKIVIDPRKQYKRDGQLISVKGRYIQFVNGKFYARTEDELAVIKEYMSRNSDVHEMTEADKEYLKAKARVINNNGEKNKAFEKIFGENRGRQGAVG